MSIRSVVAIRCFLALSLAFLSGCAHIFNRAAGFADTLKYVMPLSEDRDRPVWILAKELSLTDILNVGYSIRMAPLKARRHRILLKFGLTQNSKIKQWAKINNCNVENVLSGVSCNVHMIHSKDGSDYVLPSAERIKTVTVYSDHDFYVTELSEFNPEYFDWPWNDVIEIVVSFSGSPTFEEVLMDESFSLLVEEFVPFS